MNLDELQEKVNNAISDAIDFMIDPADVDVSIQIDDMAGKSVFATDLELHYDNDCQASGCVLVGVIPPQITTTESGWGVE